ncbi:MAG: preprotein translocase subunit SecE [Patescibacteria group bacterium]|nr:preprotein translocase subunit SecE [Patescibacteria group bacterium]
MGKKPSFYFLEINNNIIRMNKLTKYIKGSYEEMKKVTWPTKKETKNYTYLVVGVSLGVAIFLGALDYLLTFILRFVI